MEILKYIKPLLKEDSNLTEVEEKLKEATELTGDKVKTFISLDENKPVFDSIVSKAVQTHIDKEKKERTTWEEGKKKELLEEAKKAIQKEGQKTPDQLRIEELEKKGEQSEKKEARATLKANLLSIVEKEKLSVNNVDLFLQYGENAETKLREEADLNKGLIEESVKKISIEKYGNKEMPGGGNEDPKDNKPISTEAFLEESGIK